MPPRLPSSRFQPPVHYQCSHSRPYVNPDSQHTRAFHASSRHATRLRRNMYAWLNGPGKAFRDPLPASTNYLSAYDRQGNLVRARRPRDDRRDQGAPGAELSETEIRARDEREGLDEAQREEKALERETGRWEAAELAARGGIPRERPTDLRPYPLNQSFRSQPVLAEELREQIYLAVAERGANVEDVASGFGVDVRRVAAVVRLKTIEKQWERDGKRLAKPYAEAVLAMLPKTPFKADTKNPIVPHESINDLPVHPRTRQQIFYPASESRHFTREDAAKVFDDRLLPADKRIPLPDLIRSEKLILEGVPRDERLAILREDNERKESEKAAREAKQRAWEERTQRVVPGRRWDFKFQDISAEKVGKDGRGREAVGHRYGFPHEDRKRGMVKIPTSVE